LAEVQAILKKFIDLSDKAPAMYKKSISLALLEATFRQPIAASSDSDRQGFTLRVAQIGLFLENYFDKLSAFDDVKDYVAELTFEEAKYFMEDILAKMLAEVSKSHPAVVDDDRP